MILEYGVAKAVEEGLVPIEKYKQVKQSVDLFRIDTVKLEQAPDTRGVWFWGPPGTGKSKKARDDYPDIYLKQQNKWWDGYTGQETVLIDDFDKMGACLSHHLKIWADRYGCTGETKGGCIPLNYKTLVITSNYQPEDLWDDPILVAAIRRRFKVT